MARIVVLDYGMGNLRSVEKALERVGRRGDGHRRRRTRRRGRRADSPWSRSVSEGGRESPRAGPRPTDRRPARGRHRGARHLPRVSLLPSNPRPSSAGPRGSLCSREVIALRSPGSRFRTSAGSRCAGSATPSSPMGSRARRRSTSCIRSLRGRHPTDVLGTAEHGERRLRDRPPAAVRGPVSPREVERRRPAPATQLRRHLRFEKPPQGRRGSASCFGLSLRLQGHPRPRRRSGVIFFPAIDIRGGRAVRLVQGDYNRETAFDADPVDAAKRWQSQGAEELHVVDLDGAREGAPANRARAADLRGGLRPGAGRGRLA